MAAKTRETPQAPGDGVACIIEGQNKAMQSLLHKALNIYVSHQVQSLTDKQKQEALCKAIEESVQ